MYLYYIPMKHAVVLITHKPRDDVISFYNSLENYDVFVIIDDESTQHINANYTNIQFVQINSADCRKRGVRNTSHITLKKDVSGWDKALYHMIYNTRTYSHIWFIEDDIFIQNEHTLLDIDNKMIHFTVTLILE